MNDVLPITLGGALTNTMRRRTWLVDVYAVDAGECLRDGVVDGSAVLGLHARQQRACVGK